MSATFSLQQILSGDSAQLATLFQAAAVPAPVAALRKNTAEKVCVFLLKSDHFDAALAQPLGELQAAIASHIAQDDTFYCSTAHPLRQALALLLTRGRNWYARDSKASQQFLDKLNALMQSCAAGASAPLLVQLNEFQQWLNSEDKRAAMLEARLCETEINQAKTLSAEACVLDVINTALAHRDFPSELMSGVSATLKSELLHAYIISGSDNPFWTVWQRLLPLLGRTFSTIASATRNQDDEQLLYRTIPALLNELEHSLSLHTSHPDSYQPWVEQLCEHLLLAIKKQPIACAPFSALSYPEGYSDLTRSARITRDLRQQSNDLHVGDWILFSGEQQTIRCKLALKHAELDQLLFVDNTGRKVMNKSSGDVAVCLATGIAKKMQPLHSDEAIAKIIQALLELQLQKHTQSELPSASAAQHHEHSAAQKLTDNTPARSAEKRPTTSPTAAEHPTTDASAPSQAQQAAAARAQAAADEKKRIVHELGIRRAAAQKALAEAGALAEERAQRAAELQLNQTRARMQAEAAEAAQAAEHLQRIQLANINISALNLGARVELIRAGVTLNCKLAVIIAASGKYIFVDNLGRKVAELQREELVQALLDNQLTLLNKGNNFDDQLAKVIRGLRKDIS